MTADATGSAPDGHGDRGWPDMRLAAMAAGVWLSAIAALYSSPGGGARIAIGGAILAIVAAAPWQPAGSSWPSRMWQRVRWTVAAAGIGILCGGAVTATRVSLRDEPPIASLAASGARATMTLTLSGDPHAMSGGMPGAPTYAVDAQVTRLTANSRTYVVSVPVFVLGTGGSWAGLLPGQRVTVAARLQPADPGSLDAALVSVRTAPVLAGRAPWPQRAAGGLRSGLRRACAGLTGPVRGLLPGLIDGDTSGLDPTVSAAFKSVGMTHLLAVSGSNVAMVLGAVLLAARWCRAGPVVTAILCTLALAGFVILVRPSPSVLRAAAMGSLGLIALATGRTRTAFPALAACVIGLIAVNPALALDEGFALSVFATGGLLVIAPPWRDALRRRGFKPWLADAIAVPAAAQRRAAR